MKLEFSVDEQKLTKGLWRKIVLILLILAGIVLLLLRFDQAVKLLQTAIQWLMPLFVGIALAFIMDSPTTFLEKKVFSPERHKKHPKFFEKHGRGLASVCTVLLMVVALTVVAFLIIPQLIESIATLSAELPNHITELQKWVLGIIAALPIQGALEEQLLSIYQSLDLNGLFDWAIEQLTGWLGSIFSITINVTSSALQFFVSFIVSIYFLVGKENLLLNAKRVLYATFSEDFSGKVLYILRKADNSFSGFVTGQCTEALILGGLTWLGMLILQLPYATLICTIVTVAALIPFFGGMISAATGTLFLLLIDPTSALIFLIFIVILQQIEGNFIYPRVVGSSIGLPGVWVLLAVYCGGSAFGFAGIILGVPTCSMLYTLLREWTAKRLTRKQITSEEIKEDCVGRKQPVKIELEQVTTAVDSE